MEAPAQILVACQFTLLTATVLRHMPAGCRGRHVLSCAHRLLAPGKAVHLNEQQALLFYGAQSPASLLFSRFQPLALNCVRNLRAAMTFFFLVVEIGIRLRGVLSLFLEKNILQ